MLNVEVKVDISKFVGKIKWLTQRTPKIMDAAGEALWEFLWDYHSNIDWKEGNWFPGDFSGQFAEDVVTGWQKPVRHGNVITIDNTFGLLKWKTTGGSISVKNAPFLTIPLIPEARGKFVSEYVAGGKPLFKAGNALCRKVGKEIEAVYALKTSVHQNRYPGAMPPKREMQRAAQRGAAEKVREIAESS